MRVIPPWLSALLQTNASTIAQIWRLRRADGLTIYATDHSAEIALGAYVYKPGLAFSVDDHATHASLEEGGGAIDGVMQADAVSETDLAAGLWDHAEVELDLVDWTAPSSPTPLLRGRLGGVRREGARFRADLLDLKHHLETPVGRLYSRFCDAVLGDARCGVDLGAPSHRTGATVLAAPSGTQVQLSSLSAFAAGWFNGGVIANGAGAKVDILEHTRHDGADWLTLCTPIDVSVGAAVVLTAGCDKSAATCKAKFDNIVNFRGFPHMPGPDAVLGGVDPNAPLDGRGRTWR